MLTGAQLELLTAAVDGELDAREQRQLERLLAGSGEARALFVRLRQDAAAVRSLPGRGSPVDLVGPVVEAIRRQPLPAGRRTVVPAAPPPPAGVPAWFAFAVAASVLFLIGVASFLYFDASRRLVAPTDDPVAPNLVQIHPLPIPPRDKGPNDPTPERGPIAPPKYPPGSVTVERPKDPEPDRPSPTPEPPAGPIFTGPSGERIELRTVVESIAPTLHKVQGLEKARFLADLSKASAFRLELPCKDAGKVVDRLLHVAKGQNLATTIDAVAKARLDKPQVRSSYFLVLEDITPDELATFLDALAEADRKGEPKKPNETTGPVLPARLVLSRLGKPDQRDMADHLGVELAPVPPAKAGPVVIDPTRPLSEQTPDEIDRSLSAGKVVRPALLQAYGMARQVTPSADVQKYLASRAKTARPGTLQVMLVLRHVG